MHGMTWALRSEVVLIRLVCLFMVRVLGWLKPAPASCVRSSPVQPGIPGVNPVPVQ
jgi:hypothetical protein